MLPMETQEKINTLVEKYGLMPHPEGGFFAETYKSPKECAVDVEVYEGDKRALSTAIYFLMTTGNFSAWHILKSDEMWHYYEGNPVKIHVLSLDRRIKSFTLGKASEGADPQLMIGAGNYFCAEVLGDGYSLVGCTVTPGFDYRDFSLPSREVLLTLFPEHKDIIEKFTRVKSSVSADVEPSM